MKSYVGIDVSQDWLDVAVMPARRTWRTANNMKGIAELGEELLKLKPEKIAFESTGGMEIRLLIELSKRGLPAARVNPRQVRELARSMGTLAKTDRLDSIVLALFAERNKPEVSRAPTEQELLFKGLVTRRRQLVETRAVEKNRRFSAIDEMKADCDRLIEHLSLEIKLLEQRMKELARADDELGLKVTLLASAPGVGLTVARVLAAEVPELGELSHKKIATLLGVAPLNNDSGKDSGRRFTWGGRAFARSMLYMAAWISSRKDGKIKNFYLRLVQKGKPKKLALVACARKLLVCLNAMLRDEKPWKIESTA